MPNGTPAACSIRLTHNPRANMRDRVWSPPLRVAAAAAGAAAKGGRSSGRGSRRGGGGGGSVGEASRQGSRLPMLAGGAARINCGVQPARLPSRSNASNEGAVAATTGKLPLTCSWASEGACGDLRAGALAQKDESPLQRGKCSVAHAPCHTSMEWMACGRAKPAASLSLSLSLFSLSLFLWSPKPLNIPNLRLSENQTCTRRLSARYFMRVRLAVEKDSPRAAKVPTPA
eukprot:351897-Chlamydomonas_euryale.AAC.5